ncbi:MAG TPA: tyrosine-type recombinase/integrase [Terriglobales bacterium]|nr:tyrosine-type recombinase/integrase [Terriglobales bacterium]HTT21701.1 tyrosine-type recombinase/integrase [Candidatus Sulfotelmatobacter sp.]
MLREMGRRPSLHLNLPSGLRARKQRSGRIYYYYDTGAKPRREIPLGNDYALAVKRWAELEIGARERHQDIVTFRYVAERYQREVLPTKAPRTQRDNLRELAELYKFFDNPPAPLERITPQHVRQYLDWRRSAPVRANREKALFSHVFNKAREWGYTSTPNPCAGVKGFSERGRDVYVDDATYKAVWDAADWPTRDAMDLAYLTGQRPADVLKLRLADIRDGALWITQGKTGKKLRIVIAGELADVLARIQGRAYKVTSLAVVRNERGQPLSYAALDNRFEDARNRAAVAVAAAGMGELETGTDLPIPRSTRQSRHGQGGRHRHPLSPAAARPQEPQDDRDLRSKPCRREGHADQVIYRIAE